MFYPFIVLCNAVGSDLWQNSGGTRGARDLILPVRIWFKAAAATVNSPDAWHNHQRALGQGDVIPRMRRRYGKIVKPNGSPI
jgi:hypothetical protein